jgi:hypothetical protein
MRSLTDFLAGLPSIMPINLPLFARRARRKAIGLVEPRARVEARTLHASVGSLRDAFDDDASFSYFDLADPGDERKRELRLTAKLPARPCWMRSSSSRARWCSGTSSTSVTMVEQREARLSELILAECSSVPLS